MEILDLLARVNTTDLSDTPTGDLFDSVNGLDIDPNTEGMTITFVDPDPVVRRELSETERLHSRYFQYIAGRRVERKPVWWKAARA